MHSPQVPSMKRIAVATVAAAVVVCATTTGATTAELSQNSHITDITAEANPSCCAYNVNGDTTPVHAIGLGTFPFPVPTDPQNKIQSDMVPIAIQTSPTITQNKDGSITFPYFMIVLGSADPQDSVAGWRVSQNQTAQSVIAWKQIPGSPPTCYQASNPLPSKYMPGFNLCGGSKGADASFPMYNQTYPFLPNVPAYLFSSYSNNVASVLTTSAEGSCTPMSLISSNNPFATGAFTVTIQTGGPGSLNWDIPSFCNA